MQKMLLKDPPQKASHTEAETTRSSEEPELESDGEEEKERELEELESEVKEMANRILEYRATLPDQLMTTCTSLLLAQRPVLPGLNFGDANSGEQATSLETPLQPEEDQKTAERISLLKDKISSNVSAVPIVLKRMKECMSKMEKLDSYNVTIHPAFKRKKH